LFGAQIQGRFALSPNTNLTLAATNLYYYGTDAINPIQVFGGNLQLPVTVTVPATATTPSQTATGVINIPRICWFQATPIWGYLQRLPMPSAVTDDSPLALIWLIS